jgi:hypothetical protein
MYNANTLSPGPILLPHMMRAILTKRLTFRGFIVSDFAARYRDFMRDVSVWVGEGRIKYREDVVEGLENAPRALYRPPARGEFWEAFGANCACLFVTDFAPKSLREQAGRRVSEHLHFSPQWNDTVVEGLLPFGPAIPRQRFQDQRMVRNLSRRPLHYSGSPVRKVEPRFCHR